MFYRIRPTLPQIEAFLAAQASRPVSYSEVGRTQDKPPAGYFHDCQRATLGTGEAAWQAARGALARWETFAMPWVQVVPAAQALEPGREVAIAAGRIGIWTLNACRIVYTIDEDDGQLARFGFANGTLPDHITRGEERFLVQWDRRTGRVEYEIKAFSWPNHWIACCGLPLVRRFQRQFRHDSIRAVQRAVKVAAAPST
jgi:uncharacterized protein (UPF0548 family)